MSTLQVTTRKRTSVLTLRRIKKTHNELVEAARAAAGLWSKRPVTRAQLKNLRKRLSL